MKKVKKEEAVQAKNGGPEDAGLKAEMPTLHDYLTCLRFEDGDPRITSTMTVMTDTTEFVVFLNDRHYERSTSARGRTMAEALMNLETSLSEDTAQWRYKTRMSDSAMKTPF